MGIHDWLNGIDSFLRWIKENTYIIESRVGSNYLLFSIIETRKKITISEFTKYIYVEVLKIGWLWNLYLVWATPR